MSARVLVAGVLFRAPARKTSNNGRPYVFATIREGNGDAARWWKVFVFHDLAIEAIERLSEGEAIAVSGAIEAKIYAAAGKEPRVDLAVTADAILTATPKPRERKADKPPRSAPATAADGPAPTPWDEGGPNDAIPF